MGKREQQKRAAKLLQAGKVDQALQAFESLAQRHPGQTGLWHQVADLYQQQAQRQLERRRLDQHPALLVGDQIAVQVDVGVGIGHQRDRTRAARLGSPPLEIELEQHAGPGEHGSVFLFGLGLLLLGLAIVVGRPALFMFGLSFAVIGLGFEISGLLRF